MSPEWADWLLKKNVGNRPLSLPRVRELARAIMAGEWQLSHQGIAISVSGELLDGQHRLSAITAAGKTVPLLLSTGCDPATFKVVDTGYKRTAGQVLAIGGVSCSKETAAACRLAMAYERIPHLVWASSATSYTNSDIAAWHESVGGLMDFAVRTAISGRNRCALVKVSSLAAFLFVAGQAGYAQCTLSEFVAQLCDGHGLHKESPVFSFRRALINGAPEMLVRVSSKGSQAWIASLICVFNSWVQRRPVKLFRVPAFPPMPKVMPPCEYDPL